MCRIHRKGAESLRVTCEAKNNGGVFLKLCSMTRFCSFEKLGLAQMFEDYRSDFHTLLLLVEFDVLDVFLASSWYPKALLRKVIFNIASPVVCL